jgi:subtilisin family serine protease
MIRVAVIDSGVHASHPHVNGVAGGIGIDSRGVAHADFVDRLGHGTAVTAVIREKAPAAEILAIKVFDRELTASGRALVAACRWAMDQHARLVNLSLGTLNLDHSDALAEVVAEAVERRTILVAAGPEAGRHWLPGSLDGVCKVSLDWTLPRDRCRATLAGDGSVWLAASGYPRPIPGVPPERNLKGLSFAVANATGLLAALCEKRLEAMAPNDLLVQAIDSGWSG